LSDIRVACLTRQTLGWSVKEKILGQQFLLSTLFCQYPSSPKNTPHSEEGSAADRVRTVWWQFLNFSCAPPPLTFGEISGNPNWQHKVNRIKRKREKGEKQNNSDSREYDVILSCGVILVPALFLQLGMEAHIPIFSVEMAIPRTCRCVDAALSLLKPRGWNLCCICFS